MKSGLTTNLTYNCFVADILSHIFAHCYFFYLLKLIILKCFIRSYAVTFQSMMILSDLFYSGVGGRGRGRGAAGNRFTSQGMG